MLEIKLDSHPSLLFGTKRLPQARAEYYVVNVQKVVQSEAAKSSRQTPKPPQTLVNRSLRRYVDVRTYTL
jgi:hypothetical protein